jgi:hypothetical protein
MSDEAGGKFQCSCAVLTWHQEWGAYRPWLRAGLAIATLSQSIEKLLEVWRILWDREQATNGSRIFHLLHVYLADYTHSTLPNFGGGGGGGQKKGLNFNMLNFTVKVLLII